MLFDYAAGVLSAADIRPPGPGAIRYVSDRRPGAQWMWANRSRSTRPETCIRGSEDRLQLPVRQTGDRRLARRAVAGVTHAKRGLELHTAAGGPTGAPIYASIDDNPSYQQYTQQIAPYLRGWESVIGHQRSASTAIPR